MKPGPTPASVFASFLSKGASFAPGVVEQFSEGMVYGAYGVAPMYVEYRERVPGGRPAVSYAIVPGLHVVVVNPNPFTTEVVLVAYRSAAGGTYKVVDVGTTYGFTWDGGGPPPGVGVVSVSWFNLYGGAVSPKGLRMAPRTAASFSIPLYDSKIPDALFACTEVGCVRLQALAAEQHIATGRPADWVIFADDIWRPYFAVSQTWEWVQEVLGSPTGWCLVTRPDGSAEAVGSWISCCRECPLGTSANIVKIGWSACITRNGAIASYSLSRGFPPNVIAGYYAKDRGSFDFEVPSSAISVGGLSYRLYGFVKLEPEFVSVWLDYPDHACLIGNITLTIRLFAAEPKSTGRLPPLSTVWTKSTVVYVYAAVKGYEGVLDEKDTVVLEVYALEWGEQGFRERHIKTIASRGSDLVDNRQEVGEWRIRVATAVGVQIRVRYIMKGPVGWGDCVSWCGGRGKDTTRLGFYVELIPHEYLGAG